MLPSPSPSGFNLSAWALRHRPLVLFLMVLLALGGVFAYGQLGQFEDPPFTFKVVVVKTSWPGAAAREIAQQVTDRIERKLQELPLRFVSSYSRPGESVVFVSFDEALTPVATEELRYQVRKKVGDIRHTLPPGVQGPVFNDEFGDTYTNLYALTGEGYSYHELRDFADRIRDQLLRLPNVAKVDYIGLGVARAEWGALNSTVGFTLSDFQYNVIPAPGALALLGVAGLVGARRRRD